MKERIQYIDVAKGILIILVVLHHFPQLMGQYGVSNSFLKFLDGASDYYNAFFMPAFFIITGYCTDFRKLPFRKFFTRQVYTLMLPAFCLGAVSVWINLLGKGCTDPIEYCKIGFNTFVYQGGVFWFLTAMFIAKIIMRVWIFIIDKIKGLTIVKFNVITMVFCICMYILGCLLYQLKVNNIWWFEHALELIVFLFIGQIYKSFHTFKTSLFYGILYILLIGSLQLLGLRHPYITAVINARIEDFPLLLFLALTGSLLILRISVFLQNNFILEYFGQNSLIIYCLHISTIGYVYHIGERLFGEDTTGMMIFSVIQLIVSVLLLYFFVWLFNLKYLRILQGKF